MEQLVKAQQSLEQKRAQVVEFIEKAVKDLPELTKAFQDLKTLDTAIAQTNAEITKAQDLKKAEEAKAKNLKDAVEAVLDLVDKGEIDDDKLEEVAEKYELEVDALKDAVDKELDK